MTRNRLVVLVVILGAALAAGLCVRGSGPSDPPVAHVGGEAITQDQLAAVVDHFRKQSEADGKPFPDEQSESFPAVRNRLLALLVYRAELDQAARRLGITISDIQVLRKLNENSEGEEHDTSQFAFDTVKSQLQYQDIYAKVTEGITAPTITQQSARRNAAMSRYVAKLKREAQVRYEPGYAPQDE